MNAIILASGYGTRLKPYTDTKNKVMFKVNGKPLLQYHIENLIKIGVTKIIVTASWKMDEILELASKYKEVSVYLEKKLLGSYGAIRDIVQKFDFNRYIVIYGDTWYNECIYKEIPGFYNLKKNWVFVQDIGCISNSNKDKNTGLILYKKIDSLIEEISENGKLLHSNIGKTHLIGKNTGILILSNIRIANEFKPPIDLMKDYLPILVKQLPQPNQLYAYDNYIASISGLNWWHDIGTLDRYIQINLHFYKSHIVSWLLKSHTKLFIDFTKRILEAERIFICGNGGSLSTSQHLALDWSKVGKKETYALDSPSAMSAYGNDEGYENVFLNQLKRYKITDKDVIVLISGSGNSPNIIKVVDYYQKNILLGMSGETGQLIEKVKLTLPVDSDNIRVIEDAHLSYGHAITEIMDGLN